MKSIGYLFERMLKDYRKAAPSGTGWQLLLHGLSYQHLVLIAIVQ